jgi:hypothetical protein
VKPKTARNPKGAGPKPISKRFSDALKKDVFASLKKKAEETGKTIGGVIADLAYSSESKDFNVRPLALKMIQEILLIRETQSTSDINVAKSDGLVIGLPPKKEVVIPKEKENSEGVPLH